MKILNHDGLTDVLTDYIVSNHNIKLLNAEKRLAGANFVSLKSVESGVALISANINLAKETNERIALAHRIRSTIVQHALDNPPLRPLSKD